jgi:hypothetical protein
MALPMNNTPVYSLTIPSTGKEFKFRPFLVKEEKTLLIAQQSEDLGVMVDSLKGVIQSCAKTEIDINSLATFDLEYMFMQIRAKSVGEQVELFLKCDTCTDEKATSKVVIDLPSIKVDIPEGHNNDVNVFDDVHVVLKYPSLDILKKMEQTNLSDAEEIFNIVVGSIDKIYNTSEVFHAKDQTKGELLEFLENLTSEQFTKVQAFFETMPRLRKEIDYTCPVCNKKHDKVLEGMSSFF